jgi:hypothetical protein
MLALDSGDLEPSSHYQDHSKQQRVASSDQQRRKMVASRLLRYIPRTFSKGREYG